MAFETTPWDSAEHLKTDEDMQLYLEACIEEAEHEPALILHALTVIARAKALHATSTNERQFQGLERLSHDESPTFLDVAKSLKALGFKLTIQPTA
ncbi:MAG: putative addiction module antidote protein [Merismopedia sp. SIO2A8]|nr:putative addiction module antidote protein [Symploca sp. SIO2B6]NET47171.1 putative addiction module antidote protein [Merismopedia sp. SIO2A8]